MCVTATSSTTITSVPGKSSRHGRPPSSAEARAEAAAAGAAAAATLDLEPERCEKPGAELSVRTERVSQVTWGLEALELRLASAAAAGSAGATSSALTLLRLCKTRT